MKLKLLFEDNQIVHGAAPVTPEEQLAAVEQLEADVAWIEDQAKNYKISDAEAVDLMDDTWKQFMTSDVGYQGFDPHAEKDVYRRVYAIREKVIGFKSSLMARRYRSQERQREYAYAKRKYGLL